ncbi:hypothetical protein [Kitasatospora sp. NPDC088346]|uniref:hypothetical protein n=1 Tax=Kitasatospora sp. NPDC088346 TaxID=3364073 RepID=UPI00381F5294
MDSVRLVTTIDADGGPEGFALMVRHGPITDPRLSLADLGLYLRCLWLHDVCGDLGDVDWVVRELRTPAEETRAGLRRLADAGYVEILGPGPGPGPGAVGLKRAGLQAEAVRTAAAEPRSLFSDAELAIVARFVALTEERAGRASRHRN